ncbi:MAG: dephospho-CoA kinase [Acidobacteria bacterium]|nr:dephospho-CoA kinase [Acidobacteriota bacterium]
MSPKIHGKTAHLLTAGLTGSIATGKSTVAGFFRQLGDVVLDADVIARKILDRPAVRTAIQEHFGPAVMDATGAVDRPRLAEIIFDDETARLRLNTLTHPAIRREIRRRLRLLAAAGAAELVIVEVPLLLESARPRRYGPVILAYCPAEIQLQRLMRRDGLSHEAAERRIRAQIPIDEKRPMADYIIDTSTTETETKKQALQVRRRLINGRY